MILFFFLYDFNPEGVKKNNAQCFSVTFLFLRPSPRVLVNATQELQNTISFSSCKRESEISPEFEMFPKFWRTTNVILNQVLKHYRSWVLKNMPNIFGNLLFLLSIKRDMLNCSIIIVNCVNYKLSLRSTCLSFSHIIFSFFCQSLIDQKQQKHYLFI